MKNGVTFGKKFKQKECKTPQEGLQQSCAHSDLSIFKSTSANNERKIESNYLLERIQNNAFKNTINNFNHLKAGENQGKEK
jgi:hypothetical protein